MSASVEIYKPRNPVRIVTATSLFDGHDAAINIMRRIIQDTGVEVIHLGHNRSVQEIVDAAVEEDVQGVAVSSYQGGHIEFFNYLVDLLRERGAAHVKVFGGGGGVIVPEEIKELERYGVTKIFSPEDGARLGLQGMINLLVQALDFPTVGERRPPAGGPHAGQQAPGGEPHLRGRVGQGPRERPPRAPAGGIPGADRPPHRAGRGHHRDGRGRQILADRRAHRAHPARPAGGARRGAQLRPLPPQDRRGAARGPHPHERDRHPAGLHALARHPRVRDRGPGGAARRHPGGQGGRLRPRHHRNGRHRPGRLEHRRPGGRVPLRHDERVRRGLPAREDRHARLRRPRGGQQVREARQRRRRAARAQADAAQPQGLRPEPRRDAGLRHHRLQVQRRRGDRPLPRPDGRRRGQDRGALRDAAAAPRRQDLLLEDHHHPARARALPERDRRHRARLPPGDPPPDGRAAPLLAPGGDAQIRRRRPVGDRRAPARRGAPGGRSPRPGHAPDRRGVAGAPRTPTPGTTSSTPSATARSACR